MPQLTHLCLCGCNLKDAAVEKSVQGRWLKLQHLDLSNNQLIAMGRLAKGEWPVLKALLVEGNSVTALGFTQLLDANWPKLTDLTLDMQRVQSVTCNFLNLDIQAMQQLGVPQTEQCVRVSRLLDQIASCPDLIWPQLENVSVWCHRDPMIRGSILLCLVQLWRFAVL